mmetsp:Transcript_17512/g.49738  ORF Transcript_17512/g.49738 Transcript_17512/m.49738 type:complete len:233 (-) Transcript_17512:146-844(-)
MVLGHRDPEREGGQRRASDALAGVGEELPGLLGGADLGAPGARADLEERHDMAHLLLPLDAHQLLVRLPVRRHSLLQRRHGLADGGELRRARGRTLVPELRLLLALGQCDGPVLRVRVAVLRLLILVSLLGLFVIFLLSHQRLFLCLLLLCELDLVRQRQLRFVMLRLLVELVRIKPVQDVGEALQELFDGGDDGVGVVTVLVGGPGLLSRDVAQHLELVVGNGNHLRRGEG